MNIIELCTSKGWGGLELYAWQVSSWLREHQHDCHLVAVAGSLIARRLSDTGIDMTSIKPIFRFLPVVAAFRLARLIDERRTDILHVHWNKDLILAALAKRISHRPVKLVFSRHMALTRHKRDFYHKFIYHSIDLYLVITKKLYTEAKQFLPIEEHKLQLLYHGVADSARPNSEDCRRFLAEKHIQEKKFRILLPGRIEYYKGQHTLVEAAMCLQQSGYDVEIAVLGHIMDQAYFERLQKQISDSGLERNIHYLGFVDKPGLIYACFDVVVLTTYAETFGLVLVEAMKSGVAVIGTNAGGVPEIIEHGKTGMLFEPGDATELAACLQTLIEDSALCERLAQAGKAYADATFSEQQHYDKLLQLFSELIKDKSEKIQ